MKKYAWITDPHLNFLTDKPIELYAFYDEIKDSECDGVFITGDIGEADSICPILEEMESFIKKPIYFVLGNHDFYDGSIDSVENDVWDMAHQNERLIYLPGVTSIDLSETTKLIGENGWYDGRNGDYENSRIVMNDWGYIKDFRTELNPYLNSRDIKKATLEVMQKIAGQDTAALEASIYEALAEGAQKLIILTHVPPFARVSMHRGKISSEDTLPFYSSKVMGDMLIDVAKASPEIEFLVLCGHTHCEAAYQPLDNMIVRSGHSKYGEPCITDFIEVI